MTADDRGLARRAAAGDDEAFEVLYRSYVGRVYAVCLRLSGDAAEAAELTQDAFVRAWERLASFRGESAFGSWLHRVAVNEVLMHWRRRTTHQHAQLTDETVDAAFEASLPAADRMDLEAAIAALPERPRRVLVLHDLEGYAHEEIAKLMGIAAGTSKAHLFRARRLLRKALSR